MASNSTATKRRGRRATRSRPARASRGGSSSTAREASSHKPEAAPTRNHARSEANPRGDRTRAGGDRLQKNGGRFGSLPDARRPTARASGPSRAAEARAKRDLRGDRPAQEIGSGRQREGRRDEA